MIVTLKLDKGTVERLIQWTNITPEQSKNIIGKKLILEFYDDEIMIHGHRNKKVEISDVNGSFSLWFKLTKNKLNKLKKILKKGP